MTYSSTQDMNLSEWSDFTVLRGTGQMMVSGRKHQKPWALLLLTQQGDRVIREQIRYDSHAEYMPCLVHAYLCSCHKLFF